MILVKEAYRMVFDDDPGKAAYFQMHSERVAQALTPALEAAVQTGVLKPLPPHAVAHMILGNLKGLQMHLCLQHSEETHTETVVGSSEAAARFLTTMLCDGLMTQPSSTLATN